MVKYKRKLMGEQFRFAPKFRILELNVVVMKKSIVAIVVLICFSVSAFGWGATGHRATGWVANQYLTKKARKALEEILNGESLAIASTWMDEIKSDSTYDHMSDWHWVTIPFGQEYAQTVKNPNGDIIQTLEKIIAELKSKKLSRAEQVQKIKILIHLIGDIHQPLHVGGRDDKGGNDVKVMWFRSDSNLHRVWDSEMIDDTRLSYSELGESLGKPSDADLKAWQKSSILDWAKESQSYESNLYNIGNGKLGYRYAYLNYHIVRHRILQAGVRLAGVLNSIYG
jgi:hypothetical protein